MVAEGQLGGWKTINFFAENFSNFMVLFFDIADALSYTADNWETAGPTQEIDKTPTGMAESLFKDWIRLQRLFFVAGNLHHSTTNPPAHRQDLTNQH